LASLRDLANVHLAQDNPDSALQLLAVVLNHPASNQNSLNRPERLHDEAEKVRAQIEGQLDPERYPSAWQNSVELTARFVLGANLLLTNMRGLFEGDIIFLGDHQING
jgi:hypothetical protein